MQLALFGSLGILVGAAIDDGGNYYSGDAIASLAPEPREADKLAASDLAKQPAEKLLGLLAWEVLKEDKRPAQRYFSFPEFLEVSDLNCVERLIYIMKLTNENNDEIRVHHENITAASGLYWFLRKFPEETSWIWMLTKAHEWLLQKVNIHFSKVAAVALDRSDCLTADFRTVLMDGIARWKKANVDFSALLWNGFAFGVYGDVLEEAPVGMKKGSMELPNETQSTWSENLIFGNMWVSSVQKWFDSHAKVVDLAVKEELPQMMALDKQLGGGGQKGISTRSSRRHHQDNVGSFASFEYLRRQVFNQWALDKGLLRGLLKHVWRPLYDPAAEPLAIGDFGAGGGQYSSWLNETGLLRAFAFDGTPHATEITGGRVQELNLVTDIQLWRTFDWVLCLEVAEHVPQEHSGTLLRNLKRHARIGIVMSWSSDPEGIGHVNCVAWEAFVALVEQETGFRLDEAATRVVRSECQIDYIARSIAVFRSPV